MLKRHLPWDSQPPGGTKVDLSHPLARGLVSAVIGGQRFDAFGRKIDFSGPTQKPGRDGIQTVTNGSSDYAYIDIPVRTITTATVWGMVVPTSVSNDASVFGIGNTGTSTPFIVLRAGYATSSKVQKEARGDNGLGTIAGSIDSTSDAFVAGQRVIVGLSMTAGAGLDAYINGQKDSSSSTSGANSWTVNRMAIGCLYAAGNYNLGAYGSSLLLFYDRVLSDNEHRALAENPWQIFEPRRLLLPLAVVSGGGVTGTLATTNADDTSAASGSTTIVGTLARTNANDTVVASGHTTVTGTLAYTNINDSVVASGSTTIIGTLVRTNANDTSAASGSTTIIGTLARTNADDTVAASGSVGNITGILATTNANDTVVASGMVPSVGTLAYTNINDTSAASGSTTIVGTLAQTNANDTVAASGTSGTVTSVTIKAGSWIRYRIVT